MLGYWRRKAGLRKNGTVFFRGTWINLTNYLVLVFCAYVLEEYNNVKANRVKAIENFGINIAGYPNKNVDKWTNEQKVLWSKGAGRLFEPMILHWSDKQFRSMGRSANELKTFLPSPIVRYQAAVFHFLPFVTHKLCA